MTGEELIRQYREAMTCDRAEPPDVEGLWASTWKGGIPDVGRYRHIDGTMRVCRLGIEDYRWGRCPLPDPAACDDDEPATFEWLSEVGMTATAAIQYELYFDSKIASLRELPYHVRCEAKTRGDVRRVARVFGVELREASNGHA